MRDNLEHSLRVCNGYGLIGAAGLLITPAGFKVSPADRLSGFNRELVTVSPH